MHIEKIILEKNGIFVKYEKEETLEDITFLGLIPFLNCTISLGDCFNLHDLFCILDRHKDEYNFVFSAFLGKSNIQYYIDEINQDCPMDDFADLSYLEVYWIAEYFDHYKFLKSHPNGINIGSAHFNICGNKDSIPTIDFGPSFHGWGKWDQIDEKTNENIFGGCGIEFTSLKKMKHLNIHLNKRIVFYDGSDKFKEIISGTKEFSVYDFLSSILDEISVFETPQIRDKKLEDIDNKITEYKNKMKNIKRKDNGQRPENS